MTSPMLRAASLLLLGASLFSACNGPMAITPQPKPSTRPGALATPPPIPEFAPQPLPSAIPGNAGGSRLSESASDMAAAPALSPGAGADGDSGTGSGSAGAPAPAEAAKPSSPDLIGPIMPEPFPNPQIRPEAGLLTAGEWDDIAHWSFWLGLHKDQDYAGMPGIWGFDTRERFAVKLTGTSGPLADAPVQLIDADTQKVLFEARTNIRGEASLYANLLSPSQSSKYSIKAGLGEKTASQPATAGDTASLKADVQLEPAVNADLMLVVDTTGSMGDELEYLKHELQNVAARIAKLNRQDLTLRLSANFYKDLSDQYIVRPFPFTTDTAAVSKQLSEQSASGGGDFPEAVDVALADAVDEHKWSPTARARLLFLVLDAPAHQTEEVLKRLHTSVLRAAAKGIRIIPVASSGIDKETEFMLRMMAVTTGGRYVFLTDDSGIGSGHIKPTIGDFTVEKLNDLMVRVATEYISGDNPGPTQTPTPTATPTATPQQEQQ